MSTAREQLATFSIDTLPTLDTAVLGALELFAEKVVSPLSIPFKRPLVIGSGNAFVTGKIITKHLTATYADESSYLAALDHAAEYDGVIVISASGSKHAVAMVESTQAKGLPVLLVTNTASSPVSTLLSKDDIRVFPFNREPYTYNTSTYMGPILGGTGEDPTNIKHWLEQEVSTKLLRNFADYSAFTFILPAEFAHVTEMIQTKFDELFGPMITGRAFTEQSIKHAKTVVQSGDELFISLGVANDFYGLTKNRLTIPLEEKHDFAALMAASYFIVGKIQAAHPPYFKNNIEAYCQTASQIFGHEIKPIVE